MKKRAPASPTSATLDQLCDLLIPKLAERIERSLASKQDVEGSSPFFRSI